MEIANVNMDGEDLAQFVSRSAEEINIGMAKYAYAIKVMHLLIMYVDLVHLNH
jgi:hypothetical protein